MSEEKLYHCLFVGRLSNAAGIVYPIIVDVRCTQDRIFSTLYKQYESISGLKVFLEGDELRVLRSTRSDEIGGVIQTWEDS
jgi:hypothetical protein